MVDPINKRVQQPRNTTEIVDKYVGPKGQIIMDINRNEIRLHDGRTPGGHRIPNMETLERMFLASNSELAALDFPTEARGFLTRTQDKDYSLRVFATADGITVSNEDGVTGNPTFGLVDRLKTKQDETRLSDMNLALESGWYVFDKAAANMPAEIQGLFPCTMMVIVEDNPDVDLTQMIFKLGDSTNAMYMRTRFAGAWTAWSDLSQTRGLIEELREGVVHIPRVWTPYILGRYVREAIEIARSVDGANANIGFRTTELWTQAGIGNGANTITQGPYNMATDDRFEIGASQSTIGGVNRTASIEIEIGAVWTTLQSANIASPAGGPPKDVTVISRFIRTAVGIDICNSNWSMTSQIAGTPTGRFRVTYGGEYRAGCRGTRYRKSA